MSTKVGTIVVQRGRGRPRWMLPVVLSVVAVTVAVLAIAGVVAVTSDEPVTDAPSVTLPIFAGGKIYADRWEEKPAQYGVTFVEPGVGYSASGYARTFEETAHQRG
jgi:peptidoglycan/LPS O-acetylase OafA/YrhL